MYQSGLFLLMVCHYNNYQLPELRPQLQKVHAYLKQNSIRSEIDTSSESFGKKIRNAKTAHIPYFIILGEKDITAGVVTLESRDKGQIGQLKQEEVLKRLEQEIKERK